MLHDSSSALQLSGRDLARLLPSGLATVASRGRWTSPNHLTYLSLKLKEVQQRKIRRLLVLEPPRHGKSELISRYLPPWWLGRSPDDSVLLTSYSDRFAKLWGRRARDVFFEYGPKVFGLRQRPGQTATEDWGIDGHEGTMQTAGIGGSVVGRGADLLIIDDPIKDHLAAASQTIRDNVWEWWLQAASTRLSPDGCVVVVMTHWHQDDLAGRLLKDMAEGGETWTVIKMPAIATEDERWVYAEGTASEWVWERKAGEALWPERWPISAFAQKMRNKRSWSALYQQTPTPPSGELAQKTWFEPVKVMPAPPVRKVRFWDCAGTEKTTKTNDPDYTVGALCVADGERFYIEDIIRVQLSSGKVHKLIMETALRDGDAVVIREEEEPGSSGAAICAMRQVALMGYNYKGVKTSGSKASNWEPMLNSAEVGNVFMLVSSWNKVFLDEVADAPHGDHDDQLDAVSGSFKALYLEFQASLAAGALYPLYR